MRNITKENQITISYGKITSEYIRENGQESLLILALLSRFYTIRKEFVFSLKYLFKQLKIPLNKKDRRSPVIECINRMFESDIDSSQNIDDFILIPYVIEKSQYLIITDSEVDTILNCDKRIEKYSLFNTYVIIKRHINHETKTSYPSIRTIMDIANVVSNNTILRYVEILEDLGLITCDRSDFIVTFSGVKKANNTYRIIN